MRTGFDRAAEDYQRTRPICPVQLFDDPIQLAGLEAGGRVIEIGCSTGQATATTQDAAARPSVAASTAAIEAVRVLVSAAEREVPAAGRTSRSALGR